jgi:integrase
MNRVKKTRFTDPEGGRTGFDSRSEYAFKGVSDPFLNPTDKPRTNNSHRFMLSDWKAPKIYKGKTGSVSEQWFVYFYYRHPDTGKFVRLRKYEDLNYCDTLEDKNLYAQKLRDLILTSLERGYNPFSKDAEDEINEEKNQEILRKKAEKPYLIEALELFIKAKEDKKLAPKTIRGYKQFNLDIIGYLTASKQADLYVEDFTQEIIMDFLETAADETGWSPVTYNNHVDYIKTLIKWFSVRPRKWLIADNYLFGDDGIFYQVERVHTNRIFVDTILKKLRKEVAKIPTLEYYCKFIFYSCMRPVEIQNLRVEDVDLSSRTIRIVGKTNFRTIPISNELNEMLLSRNLEKYRAKDYVIGLRGKTGPKHFHADHWRTLFKPVKIKLELDHTYTMYGLKHTRVVSLLKAGYSDAEVMNLTGHRDTASFDKYKRELMSQMHNTRLKGDTISW